MKKKIIPLVILALAAFFLLSGCDAMLESIYPNQTGGNNTIDATVYSNTYWGYNQIYVALYKSDGTYVSSYSVWPDYYAYYMWDGYTYGYYNYVSVSFSGLKDGTYYLEAWSGSSSMGHVYSIGVSGSQTSTGNTLFIY